MLAVGSKVGGLAEQYRCIGRALVAWEQMGSDDQEGKQFTQSLVFIPSSVLESYLDDLLDLEVSDRALFIDCDLAKELGDGKKQVEETREEKRPSRLSGLPHWLLPLDTSKAVTFLSRSSVFHFASLIGLVSAVLAGVVAANHGVSVFSSICITLIAAVPPALVWYLSPRSARRRMRFAQVISRTISQRRGPPGAATSLVEMIEDTVTGAFRGVARSGAEPFPINAAPTFH